MSIRVISHLPFRRLSTTDIRRGLLSLLAQAGGAIRILLANGLAVRQVLGSINNGDESANLGPVDRQVGKDTCSVRPIEGMLLLLLDLGRHGRWTSLSCGVSSIGTVVYMNSRGEIETADEGSEWSSEGNGKGRKTKTQKESVNDVEENVR